MSTLETEIIRVDPSCVWSVTRTGDFLEIGKDSPWGGGVEKKILSILFQAIVKFNN